MGTGRRVILQVLLRSAALSAGFGFQEIHKLLLLCMCAFRLRFELRRFLDGLHGWL